MTDQLIDRPSTWGSIGDHERRIRALEALDDCCAQNDTCDGFADRVAQLVEDGVDLLGYWSLGGGAAPYADTSGNPGGPVDMALVAHGTAMTQDYTPGALSPSQDDGAVKFNAAAYNVQGDILSAGDTRFQLSGAEWTIAAWVKPTLLSSQALQFLGNFSPFNGGYALSVSGLTGIPLFQRGDSGGTAFAFDVGTVVPVDEWSFVAGTYGPTPNEMNLYVDAVLVATGTTVQGMASFSSVQIGGNNSGGPTYNSFNGGVDEAMVWGAALTADQITSLFRAGFCDSASAEAGMVLTADGSNGTYWAFPTVEVEY